MFEVQIHYKVHFKQMSTGKIQNGVAIGENVYCQKYALSV